MSGRSVALVSLIVLSLLYANLGQAAETKTPIFLTATAEDPRGKTFVFELKEQIRQSSGMRLALTVDDAIQQIVVVTMDIKSTDAIAYSAVWTWRQPDGLPAFRDVVIGICPQGQLATCARSVVAQTDEAITAAAEAGAKIWADALKKVPEN